MMHSAQAVFNTARPTCFVQCSAAVYNRLYEQAVVLKHKLDERKHAIVTQELDNIRSGKTSMSWISQEMMKDRGSGTDYGNYGEMLYAESLEAMAKKKEKVRTA